MTPRIVVRALVTSVRAWASVIVGSRGWSTVWLPSRPAADIRTASAGKFWAKFPVRNKVAATFSFASVDRIESTPAPFAPASNVSATTLRLVGMRLTTRPMRDGGFDTVGAVVLGWAAGFGEAAAVGAVGAVGAVVVLGWVVGFGEVVAVVAVDVAVDVPSAGEEVAVLVRVTDVVGTALRVSGEGPHAAATSSTPTAKAVAIAERTDVRMVAHLLLPNPLSPN